MLEAAIVLEVVLGKYIEAAIIAVLLAFNAALGFFQVMPCPASMNRTFWEWLLSRVRMVGKIRWMAPSGPPQRKRPRICRN
jgi:H+-transporting ATPase